MTGSQKSVKNFVMHVKILRNEWFELSDEFMPDTQSSLSPNFDYTSSSMTLLSVPFFVSVLSHSCFCLFLLLCLSSPAMSDWALSLSLQPDENKHILALQFSWKNGIKPKGSIFIGVSPEFEFALYTLCFLTSPNERVKVQFSFYHVEIVCHHYNQKHIGTTYPVLLKYQTPE